jgi:hypothetical protein
MTIHKQADYVRRDAILKLLSEDENQRVSMAETAPRLAKGEEYIDLERLDLGVQLAHRAIEMGHVLPRAAVHDNTWTAILKYLATPIEKPSVAAQPLSPG